MGSEPRRPSVLPDALQPLENEKRIMPSPKETRHLEALIFP
jgi:hypothetical protein